MTYKIEKLDQFLSSFSNFSHTLQSIYGRFSTTFHSKYWEWWYEGFGLFESAFQWAHIIYKISYSILNTQKCGFSSFLERKIYNTFALLSWKHSLSIYLINYNDFDFSSPSHSLSPLSNNIEKKEKIFQQNFNKKL